MADIYRDNYLPSNDKAAAYTLRASDGGKHFTQTGASGTWTLPQLADIWDGWWVRIYNVGATSLVVTAPAGKMAGFNNAAAATITFNTAGNIIGAGVEIYYDATLGKYLAIALGAGTAAMS